MGIVVINVNPEISSPKGSISNLERLKFPFVEQRRLVKLQRYEFLAEVYAFPSVFPLCLTIYLLISLSL